MNQSHQTLAHLLDTYTNDLVLELQALQSRQNPAQALDDAEELQTRFTDAVEYAMCSSFAINLPSDTEKELVSKAHSTVQQALDQLKQAIQAVN